MSDNDNKKRYEQIAEENQRHNLREFMEHGPGLRKSTRTFFLAKCPTGRHVLQGGLGGLGVGQMWHWSRDYGDPNGRMHSDIADVFDQLPVEQCSGVRDCPECGGTYTDYRAAVENIVREYHALHTKKDDE